MDYFAICPNCQRRQGWDGHAYGPCSRRVTSTYVVNYYLTQKPDKGPAVVTDRRTIQEPDGTFTCRVAITEGYTTLEDIPRIVAIAHPFGYVRPEHVVIVSATLED